MKTKGRIHVNDLPEFDAAEYLGSPELMAAYLNEVISTGDSGLLAEALGDVARARGMSRIAESTGLQRPALYKALRPGSEPRFGTMRLVLQAIGLSLVVVPSEQATRPRTRVGAGAASRTRKRLESRAGKSVSEWSKRKAATMP